MVGLCSRSLSFHTEIIASPFCKLASSAALNCGASKAKLAELQTNTDVAARRDAEIRVMAGL
jgi:hypothetical protein